MERYESIILKVSQVVVYDLTDEQFGRMYEAYDKWLFGECSKSRFNYWLKKTGLTLVEWELWVSY